MPGFGAEKVIWVLTKPKMVIVASPSGKWDLVEMLEENFEFGGIFGAGWDLD